MYTHLHALPPGPYAEMRQYQEVNEQEDSEQGESSDDGVEDSQSGVSQIQGCRSDEGPSELEEEPRPKKLAKTQAKGKGESEILASSTALQMGISHTPLHTHYKV